VSAELFGRALYLPDMPNGEKVLLLALADAANPDGYCFPGRSRLARACNCTERHISTMLAKLVERGVLAIRNRRRGGNVYLVFPTADVLALYGFENEEPRAATSAPLSGTPAAENGELQERPTRARPESGEPSGEPSTLVPDARKPTGHVGVGTVVLGAKVTPDEFRQAEAVVAVFNELAGTKVTLKPREHLRLVVGRLRDNPTLEMTDYRAVIAAELASPWWDGAPRLNVIFGPNAFPNALARSKEWSGTGSRPAGRRSVQTFDDLVAMADRLEAEGR
jgi:hypothetical protein